MKAISWASSSWVVPGNPTMKESWGVMPTSAQSSISRRMVSIWMPFSIRSSRRCTEDSMPT